MALSSSIASINTAQASPPMNYEHSSILFTRLIQAINRKVNSGLEDGELLDFIFESLDLLIPYDRIGIGLINEQESCITLVWVRSKVGPSHLGVGYTKDISKSSLKYVVETGRPRIISNLPQYAMLHPESESTRLAVLDGIKSSLACPLIAQNKACGIVFFSSFQENRYTQNHIDLFLDVADELSVLVQHEKLRSIAQTAKENERNLATTIHDLKSPIATINGYLNFSSEQNWFHHLPQEAKDTFDTLKRNSEFMLGLIEDLTQLSKVGDQYCLELNRESVDIDRFVQEIHTSALAIAESKSIAPVIFKKNAPKQAFFDQNSIRRALDNLISNAVKFSHRNTKVIIEIVGTQKAITFKVKDEGLGIPDSEIPKLFRYFGKTSVQPTEGEASSGLGLAIVKQIVDRHQGTLGVQSKQGKGSTFWFELPLKN